MGGNKIGEIYPGGLYCLIPNSAMNGTSEQIVLQEAKGVERRGYIETSPGYTLGAHPWAAYQEPFHYYNSNGSSLVASQQLTISGTSYRIFTVKKAVTYRNSSGTSQGSLAVGTQIATTASTTGQTYAGYMIFYKKKVGSGAWQNLVSGGYGFVDLGLSKGSHPTNRAIY